MNRRVAKGFRGLASDSDEEDSSIDGFYSESDPERHAAASITLRRSLPDDEAVYVFLHEYGHSVWYTQMTHSQRADYRALWKRNRRDGSLITEYAGDSVDEGFAEAFAHYLRKPRLLQRIDPDSSRFLEDLQQYAAQSGVPNRTSARPRISG